MPAPNRTGGTEGLLLVAHGSRRGDPACDRMLDRHATALAAGGGFARVATATLFGGAGPAAALDRFDTTAVAVVPLFMSNGYYVRTLLPIRLDERRGTVPAANRTAVRLCPPVGVRPELALLIADRAAAEAVAAGRDPASVSLLLIGHGSSKGPDSRQATAGQALRIDALRRFAAVGTAYLEEAPAIGDSLRLLAGPVVAVALFAAAGLHAGKDIVEAIAATDRDDVVYLGAIGEDPGMVDIIRRCAAG